jgi:cell division control protein 11
VACCRHARSATDAPSPSSTHLTDLKEITHDFLYENYRTEKLSRTVHSDYADASIPGDELANQSVRLKEEQLRKEEDKLREIELKVQREIQEKRQELMAKEESLRNLETRLAVSRSSPAGVSPVTDATVQAA